MKFKKLSAAAVAAAALSAASWTFADSAVFDNGPGNGTVSVTIDGYGGFGSAMGALSSDAIFDPIDDATGPDGTTFQSYVAIRVGGSGTRDELSTGAGLPDINVNQNGLTANSSFSHSGLDFVLTQTLQPLFDGSDRTGSVLTQSFQMTNNGTSAINGVELVRYIDGDLQFSGGFSNDGGGRLVSNDGTEIMFETDTAAGTANATTFLGITGEGGTAPATNRFEADSYFGLASRIAAGDPLDDQITGDGADGDQFVDASSGYDITLALRNLFSFGAGDSATYSTRTIFGTGVPEDVPPPPPPSPPPGGVIPLPLGFWAGMSMFAAIGGAKGAKRIGRRRS